MSFKDFVLEQKIINIVTPIEKVTGGLASIPSLQKRLKQKYGVDVIIGNNPDKRFPGLCMIITGNEELMKKLLADL